MICQILLDSTIFSFLGVLYSVKIMRVYCLDSRRLSGMLWQTPLPSMSKIKVSALFQWLIYFYTLEFTMSFFLNNNYVHIRLWYVQCWRSCIQCHKTFESRRLSWNYIHPDCSIGQNRQWIKNTRNPSTKANFFHPHLSACLNQRVALEMALCSFA